MKSSDWLVAGRMLLTGILMLSACYLTGKLNVSSAEPVVQPTANQVIQESYPPEDQIGLQLFLFR